MKKQTQTFIITLVSTLALVVAVDLGVGAFMQRAIPQMGNCEETSSIYYSLERAEAPIVIVGASKTINNYIPAILKDSLGIEVHTAGTHNTDISYISATLNSILDRYTPQLFIIDVSGEYLCTDIQNNVELLYPLYSSNKHVKEAVDQVVDGKQRMMLMSHLYQYNSALFRLLIRYCINRNAPISDGFKPVDCTENIPYDPWESDTLPAQNPAELQLLAQLVQRAHGQGSRIVFVESPVFHVGKTQTDGHLRLQQLADKLHVTLLDNTRMEGINDAPRMFHDFHHLSIEGAEIHTKLLATQLHNLLLQ